jgi:hypothetical protein
MCQKHWGDINFSNVPSVAMTNLTKAFQDIKTSKIPVIERTVKKIKRSQKRSKHSQKYPKIIDNRRHHEGDADYEDREKCRQNLMTHISSGKKINAKVSNLSDIINKYLLGENQDITWEAQWKNRVKEIQELISKLPEKPSIFPMVDLSSSMIGSPIINAITLGMFTSIVMDNLLEEEEFSFANRFMSFASTPQLVKLPRFSLSDITKPATLKEKVDIMKEWTRSGKWGGSTNIHAALHLLLTIAKQNNVPQKDMPKIFAIFSDMQFDQGDSSWNKTSYEEICDKFTNAGYEVPHIIFWNLRGNTDGFQIKVDTPKSYMLSGYSTRMLNLFLTGDVNNLTELSINNERKIETEKENNTLHLINKALNHDMFKKYNEMFEKLLC